MAQATQQSYGIVRLGQTLVGIPIHELSEVCHVNGSNALPVPSDTLLGAFELRGSAVPLLNIARICGGHIDAETPHLAVVLKHADAVLAFHVDEVVGIANCAEADVQPLEEANDTAQTSIRGVFKSGDRFVSILDIPAIFELPGVYSTQRPGLANTSGATERLTRQLTFQAGGALFAVPAIEVYAAVPRQEIKVTAITSGPCLGEISYYGRRVPVACSVSVLGLGKTLDRGACEIVVMRFPNDQLLGFAVDAIRNIESFQPAEVADLPIWQDAAPRLISNVNIKANGQQIYTVDIAALHQHPEALNLASLSEPSVTADETTSKPDVTAEDGNVIRERERYLVVKAGTKVAIPLCQVSCITAPPKEITPTRSHMPGFKGYFSRLGRSVALFGLSEMLFAAPQDDQDHVQSRRVVLTGADHKQIGFEVAQVISIEVSEWREQPKEGETGPAVQLGSKANRTVLPVVDLDALVPA